MAMIIRLPFSGCVDAYQKSLIGLFFIKQRSKYIRYLLHL